MIDLGKIKKALAAATPGPWDSLPDISFGEFAKRCSVQVAKPAAKESGQ